MSLRRPDPAISPEAPALRAEDLTKVYPLYERRSDRLREWLSGGRTVRHRDFYALRGVSLEVRPGEVVGIVGRNGSGKSTLLKLISGITAPTSGRVSSRGRISALVELGAGFNPEYNGLENIFLNGTILGYSRPEIEARLEEILAFAEIGDYIRQPVRTYSSGMLVRLAFAVAITVDPDILIVDEALSVGDALFQRKCFERLGRFRQEGKTILFVSHSLDTVAQLCGRALLLDAGELLLDASPKLVRNFYYKLLHAEEAERDRTRRDIAALNRDREALARLAVEDPPAPAADSGEPVEKAGPERDFYLPDFVAPSRIEDRRHPVDFEEIRLLNGDGRPVNHLSTHQDYTLSFRIRFGLPVRGLRLNLVIRTVSGFTAAAAHEPGRPAGTGDDRIEAGQTLAVTWRFHCALLAGTYFATLAVLGVPEGGSDRQDLIRIVDAVVFKVLADPLGRNGGLVHLGQRLEVRRI